MSQAGLAGRVAEVFRTLPERYLGAEPGFDATYHLRIGDIGRTWEVRCTTHGARVRSGATQRRPDVTIGTDAATWLALREGRLSGVEAFSQRKLYARGDLDLAVGFEGMFRRPDGRDPLVRIHHVPVARPADLDADDGRRSRRAAAARPRRRQVLVLRHRRGAQPQRLPRPRARPAGLRRLDQAGARPLRRALVRRRPSAA